MKQFLLFVMTLLPLIASADVTGKCGANVYYSYNESTQKLTISGKGPMSDYEDMMDDYSYPWRGCSIKFLEIEDGVTSVGDFNFSNKGMISLSLPNSVTSIGQCAFYGCGSLNSIELPNSLTRIGNNAFTGCNNLTTIVSEIVNPYSIDNSVFSSVFSKAKLIVPKGTISKYKATDGWKSFANIVEATGNEEADITDNGIYYHLKSDGSLEVTGLASWTTLADIPSSIIVNGTKYRVTSIGAYAFKGRSDITYLSIPYSIKSIGEYAFMDCGSNMTVNIADPESWCQMQLGNEHASPLSSAGKMLVHDIETDRIDIPEEVTSIGAFTFYQCSCLQSLSIPGSVTSIGSSAFEDCDNLASLTLNGGLQSIGGSAFEGCKRLLSVTIPSSVNSIAINAFKNCSGLYSVISEIENLFAIDNSVFNGVPSNAELTVPIGKKSAYQSTAGWNKFTNIVESSGKCGEKVYYFYDGATHTLTIYGEGEIWRNIPFDPYETLWSGLDKNDVLSVIIEFGVTSISKMCFLDFRSMTSITIPNSVTSIGEMAFYGCANLASISFPSSVISIGSDAFDDTPLYKNQPDGVIYVDKFAYRYKGEMPANTQITIKDGTLGIADYAFSGCKGLTSVTIPNSVTSIGRGAFYGCSGLASVVSEIDNPFAIDNNVFNGIPSKAQLIVPKGFKAKYQTTVGWSNFTNIMEMIDGDVNGDGVVNDADVKDVASHIMGMTPKRFNKDAADVNNDNKVNAADIVLINIIKSK